jgi:hypothetical protein
MRVKLEHRRSWARALLSGSLIVAGMAGIFNALAPNPDLMLARSSLDEQKAGDRTAITLLSTDGENIEVPSRDRPTALIFLCGCAPCRRAIAIANGVIVRNPNVRIMGVTSIGLGDAKSLKQTSNADFPILLDESNRIAKIHGASHCPYGCFFDGKTQLETRVGGPMLTRRLYEFENAAL